jgi:2-oxoglutarate dehydrogenase complex dehydrogenase (E1) component-like enzyme
MNRTVRKPLVALTPKSLLRAPDARSATGELTEGHFSETLDDPRVGDKDAVERILLCTGKIAYQLAAERERRSAPAAIVRVEQLYPFPEEQLIEIISSYRNATELRWVQEEPENMGAYGFMHLKLHRALRGGPKLSHVARPESASPATGSTTVHEREQRELIEGAFS